MRIRVPSPARFGAILSLVLALSDTAANLGRRRLAMLEVLEDVDDGASCQR